MSSFEIFLIVLACSVPVVALLFLLPKKLKKQEKPKPVEQSKTYEEIKKEDVKVEEAPKEKTINSPIEKAELNDLDFKNYLKQKQSNMTKPKRAELPPDFVDRTEDYFPRRRGANKVEKTKNVAEEIKSLSPELKALIIAGVLDPKDFDKV